MCIYINIEKMTSVLNIVNTFANNKLKLDYH